MVLQASLKNPAFVQPLPGSTVFSCSSYLSICLIDLQTRFRCWCPCPCRGFATKLSLRSLSTQTVSDFWSRLTERIWFCSQIDNERHQYIYNILFKITWLFKQKIMSVVSGIEIFQALAGSIVQIKPNISIISISKVGTTRWDALSKMFASQIFF